MFLINRIIDVIFITDLFVQFCVMVEKTARGSSAGTVWLTSHRSIAREYFRTWFFLDIFSVAVSVFDFLGLDAVRPLFADGGDDADAASSTSDLSNLKAFRVLRVLRLIKLARLVRASRVLKRWEMRVAVNYAMLALIKAMATLVILAHWISCVWVLQARLQNDLSKTWLGRLEYCRPIVAPAAASSGSEWDCPPMQVYAGGAYYAAATITSIGYGDITPTHHNIGETMCAVSLMFTSCVAWAHLLGVFSGVVSTFNPELNAFRETSAPPPGPEPTRALKPPSVLAPPANQHPLEGPLG
jgi:hypothetical protein